MFAKGPLQNDTFYGPSQLVTKPMGKVGKLLLRQKPA